MKVTSYSGPGYLCSLMLTADICLSSYLIHYIVTCMGDYRRGFGLDFGFIDHLYTRLGTTSSATANLNNSQITSYSMFVPVFVAAEMCFAGRCIATTAARTTENAVLLFLYHCYICFCCCGNVFTEPLPRNGPDISAHLAAVALQRLYAL
jgi:hypothetical protein